MSSASCRYMKPEGLLSAIIAVYPPEGSGVERAGALPGERKPAAIEGSRLVGLMLHCRTKQICLRQGHLAASTGRDAHPAARAKFHAVPAAGQ